MPSVVRAPPGYHNTTNGRYWHLASGRHVAFADAIGDIADMVRMAGIGRE
jgi:hypothetical protein